MTQEGRGGGGGGLGGGHPLYTALPIPFQDNTKCPDFLKGNCANGKISFLLFAFLSSPRSISKCGKISKLLVKYPLCCGQINYEFLQYFLCGRGLFMTQIREGGGGGVSIV